MLISIINIKSKNNKNFVLDSYLQEGYKICVVRVLQVSAHLRLFNIGHQLLSGISQLKKIKNQKIQIRKHCHLRNESPH